MTTVWRLTSAGPVPRLVKATELGPQEVLAAEVGGMLVIAEVLDVVQRLNPAAARRNGAARIRVELSGEAAAKGLRAIADERRMTDPGWRVEVIGDDAVTDPADPSGAVIPPDPSWDRPEVVVAVDVSSGPSAATWRVRSVPPILPLLSPAAAARQTLRRLEVLADAGSGIARLAWNDLLGPLPPAVVSFDAANGQVTTGPAGGTTVLLWDARQRGGSIHVMAAPETSGSRRRAVTDLLMPVIDGEDDGEALILPDGGLLRVHGGAPVEDAETAALLASWSGGTLSWPGIMEARERTLLRARELFPSAVPFADPFAVDDVEHGVLYRATASEGPLTPELRDAMRRVTYEQILGRSFGTQILCRLVLESDLEKRVAGGTIDAPQTADALTAYASFLLERMTETAPFYRWNIHRLVTQFLKGERQPQARVTQLAAEVTASPAWEALWRHAPWLLLFGPPSTDPPRVAIGGSDLLDVLALTRPTHGIQTTQAGAKVETKFQKARLDARWHRLFRLVGNEVPTLAQLEALADVAVYVLSDPSTFARRVQALDLPEVLRDAARMRSRTLSGVSSPAQVLAVRCDDARGRSVMIVNLSPDSWLRFRVDAGTREHLDVNAIPTPRAYRYASKVVPMQEDSVVSIEDVDIPLHADARALERAANVQSFRLSADVFRGREAQLAKLRLPLKARGPRAGSLIYGTRRSGKSTLAYQVGEGQRVRERLFIDLSDTAASTSDHREWQVEICDRLASMARRRLGVSLSERSMLDIVELIRELDQSLDGSEPVVLVFDEFDTLLLPHQGDDGSRTATRIGNLVLDNVQLIACVQRFHSDAVELKDWQRVPCPADLHWADGVTYFFPLLSDLRPGPRVEWLDRVSVHPYLFSTVIEPYLGRRPYFWAQLRSKLDALPGLDPTGSRLIERALVRASMEEVVRDDGHLSQLLTTGGQMSDVDRRRRDLLSDDERMVLICLAHRNNRNGETTVRWLEDIAGPAPVRELVDRAILEPTDTDGEMGFAVPIYRDFLRRKTTPPPTIAPTA